MDIYTPLEQAKEEVWKRWSDQALRKEIAAYLGDIPEPFVNEPRSVLDRTIMTPDNEFMHFLKLSSAVQLSPLVFEYLDDKFCSKNPDKLALAKMLFHHGRNKNNEAIINHRTVADCSLYDGKRISDMKTLWGEPFVSFHHRLFPMHEPTVEKFDASAWFHSHGKSAKNYYPKLLSIFICNGVLFEDFITDGSEASFTEEIMIPSFEKVQRYFGFKPFIVPLVPDFGDKYWWCYPDVVEKEIEKHA